MNANQLKKLLSAYLKNKLNKTDGNLLQNWYDSFGESEKGVPGLNNPVEEDLLKKELYNQITSRVNQPAAGTFKLNVFIRNVAAGIAIVAAGASGWYLLHKEKPLVKSEVTFQIINTAPSQLKKLVLPDSSIVYLNANSHVKIPVNFSATDRQFYLLDGEAFFEVKKDKKRPFIIHTQNLAVQVVGTSFNVRAYKSLDDVRVAVTTGKVKVSDQKKVFGFLTPGQQISYDKINHTVSYDNLNTQENHSWVQGKVNLEKASFDELAQTMYNIYGVTLTSSSNETKSYQYNLTIRSDRTLEKTMDLICAIHGNKYRRNAYEILIQ